MSLPWRLAFAFGAWLACCCANAAGLDTLDACALQASVEARGIVALEAECPGLEPALRELGLVDNLPEGWRDTLKDSELRDLGAMAHRYLDLPIQVAPEPGALRAILDQLAREQIKPPRSWWDAVREWLRSKFANRDTSSVPWLDRLLGRLADSVDLIKAIAYVLLALAVIAAVGFIVNELRIAGVLARRRETGRPREAAAGLRIDDTAPAVADLDAAALRDQPAILLRLLVARLLTNGQLRAERNLTHRELVTHSAFSDPQSRLRFARVTQLAERVLYGSGEADAAQSNAVIADGRSLLLQLQASGSARP